MEHREVFPLCLTRRARLLSIRKSASWMQNTLMMEALDAGAEDFAEEEDSYEILTSPEDFSAVREALEARISP